ncbi:MAG: hypothetical protein AB8E82_19170 [Aureispira sp.]
MPSNSWARHIYKAITALSGLDADIFYTVGLCPTFPNYIPSGFHDFKRQLLELNSPAHYPQYQ